MRTYYSKIETFAAAVLTLLVVLALPACTRSAANSSNASTLRPPEDESVAPRSRTASARKSKETDNFAAPDDPVESPKKSGMLARVFNNSASVPPYGWDGQMSSTTLKSGLVSIHLRAIESLRSMGFVVSAEESRRQEKSGKVTGVKADKTAVLILLEEKIPNETEIKIKVGLLGDRSSSERILDEVQKTPMPKTSAKKSNSLDPTSSAAAPAKTDFVAPPKDTSTPKIAPSKTERAD